MLQIQTGVILPAHRLTIMTIPGDGEILGDGMEAITLIGVGTVAGVWDYPGVGVDHSVGAGEALSDGEAHTGDMATHLTGEDIMIRSGAEVTATLIGVVVTGATDIITDPFTEEAAEEASVILA